LWQNIKKAEETTTTHTQTIFLLNYVGIPVVASARAHLLVHTQNFVIVLALTHFEALFSLTVQLGGVA
jgi:hypothetical protein